MGVLSGCGRIAFDARADGAGDGRGDSLRGSDAAVRCDWSSGEPARASAPVLVASLSSGAGEADPFLVPGDPHTMYFTSGRTGGGDIYMAHRTMLDAIWDSITPVSELDSATLSESSLVVDAGALHGYYDVLDGVAGVAKLYEVSRATTSDPYVVGRELTELDTNPVQYDPWPSPDELTMRFTAGTLATNLELYVATRATPTDTWSGVQQEPFSSAGASQQTLTADQLVVFWSAQNGATFDLFFATRASASDAFGAPQLVSVSSSSNNDYEPYIREDGCELHWTSGPGFAGTGSIYEITYAP